VLHGNLVLPGLLAAHAHLDKTYTRSRLGTIKPGLLAAIAATRSDQKYWTEEDLSQRARQALVDACSQGVTSLRTHLDWQCENAPTSWEVLRRLSCEWKPHLRLECSALVPLTLYADRELGSRVAQQVAVTDGACLGAFIHSSNYDVQAVSNLLHIACDFGLDLDLHVDEELSESACGLSDIADLAVSLNFTNRIVCSHACALSVQEPLRALSILDRVAEAPITLISLPSTNLLLQDAQLERTPRFRGITLLKEARERNIPVLLAGDNVRDAFCPLGNYDPLEALRLGVLTGQLDGIFDDWSQSICRLDWLHTPQEQPSLVGEVADLTLFATADINSWPAATTRILIRRGEIPSNLPEFFGEQS
jgi:cytosine deaminase